MIRAVDVTQSGRMPRLTPAPLLRGWPLAGAIGAVIATGLLVVAIMVSL